ncbi:MAG: MBOAT family protein, partial [Actinomyces sp.]
MLFPTFTFAAFFALVLPLTWALRDHATARKLILLVASYVFYGWWDARFLGLLIGLTLVNEVAAVAVHRTDDERRRRALVAVAVGVDLVVLGFFKYYDFFTDTLAERFGVSGPAIDVLLPVGISFYTFQAISYVVDVHRRETPPAPLLDAAVYLAFFPQLVAGPIVRATELLPELRHRRPPEGVELGRAALLIGRGLFKKLVIADFLSHAIVTDVFANPSAHGALDVLGGIYGYAVQLYADFSGYTDMAIGIALLLGFRFPRNFDRPYAAVSVQDFWRRWHMTLSRWLRDYLYFPLGGNRQGRLRTYRNLL